MLNRSAYELDRAWMKYVHILLQYNCDAVLDIFHGFPKLLNFKLSNFTYQRLKPQI